MEIDKSFAQEAEELYRNLQEILEKEFLKHGDDLFPLATGSFGISRGRKLIVGEDSKEFDLRKTLTFLYVMAYFKGCHQCSSVLPENWWEDEQETIRARRWIRGAYQAYRFLGLSSKKIQGKYMKVKEWVITRT